MDDLAAVIISINSGLVLLLIKVVWTNSVEMRAFGARLDSKISEFEGIKEERGQELVRLWAAHDRNNERLSDMDKRLGLAEQRLNQFDRRINDDNRT